MKITFITTVRHNVGDDFIREGAKFLLKKFLKGKNVNFENVHKHSPVTSRYGFEKIRKRKWSEIIDPLIPLSFTRDRIMEADLVVQSGAPVYWYHKNITDCVKDNEWYQPLIKKRYLKKNNAKLLNIAAGSCQTFFSDGFEFKENKDVCEYIQEFTELSDVTTVRDKLAQDVLSKFGYEVPLIPCCSLFANDELKIDNMESEYVVVNYMSGGGHFSFNQNINKTFWENEFIKFYQVLKKHEKVVFSCHNEKEIREAKIIDPEANIFYSHDYAGYIKLYSKAKYAFVNRIHAAYPIASFGKQAVIVGADTRAKMALEIGLPAIFVNEANKEMLLSVYENFENNQKSYYDKFNELKGEICNQYMAAFSVLNL